MTKFRALPLGVDVGTSRIRIALAETTPDGDVRLKAVSARDISEDVRDDRRLIASIIEQIAAELGARRRECIAALGSPHASLRVIAFPKMGWHERLRAARYEAQRGPSTGEAGAVVRVHRWSKGDSRFTIGVTSEAAIRERVETLRAAGLRTVAIDHDSLALRRAIPYIDAILDIGADRSTLHHYSAASPFSQSIGIGGADVTRGIARELAIDVTSAERRKRILGSAGAGITVRESLISECCALIERGRSRAPITRIVLVGNGARLPALASDLETASRAAVELMVPPLLQTGAYPEDVIRSAAPDWMLAAALTTWSIAG